MKLKIAMTRKHLDTASLHTITEMLPHMPRLDRREIRIVLQRLLDNAKQIVALQEALLINLKKEEVDNDK